MPAVAPVNLGREQHELIERLVRRDRTAVSSALLVIAGIGRGEPLRQAVLTSVGESVERTQADGAISASRAAQLARHIKRALGRSDQPLPA